MDAVSLGWLAVTLAAAVTEVVTLSLVFLMVAGGALVAAVVAATTGNAILSVVAFAVTTGLLLVAARPPLLRYTRRSTPGTPTGVAALVGRPAVVIAEVGPRTGQIKLAGEIWSARSAGPGPSFEIGAQVEVVRIDGATAVVAQQSSAGAALGAADPDDGPEPRT
jgi:membrane protein implicated in regulation of membrane protease activity